MATELTLPLLKEALRASRFSRTRPEYKDFVEKYETSPGLILRFAAAHLIELWEQKECNLPDPPHDTGGIINKGI